MPFNCYCGRLTRRRKLFILALLVLAVIIAVPMIVSHFADADWRKALAETDQLDPGWRWKELEAKRRVLSDDKNSTILLLRLRGLIDAKRLMEDEIDIELITGLDTELNYFNVRLAENQRQVIAKSRPHFAAFEKEFPRLAKMPFGRYPIKGPPSFGVISEGDLQDAWRYGIWGARYQLFEMLDSNDTMGSITTLQAAINMAGSFGDERHALAFIMRRAGYNMVSRILIRSLAQCEFTDEQLASLQFQFMDEENQPHLLGLARAERAHSVASWESAPTNTPMTSFSFQDWINSIKGIFGPGSVYRVEDHLRAMNIIVELAKKPEPACINEIEAFMVAPGAGRTANFFVKSEAKKLT